jgi:hypothetical protein
MRARAGDGPSLRRGAAWGLATAAIVAAVLGHRSLPGHAKPPAFERRLPLGGFTVEDAMLPDDTILVEQLQEAIDLRRRKDFDRMLDARDPGELLEHATFADLDFEHRAPGVHTLFVVGDDLFAYLFRPENGWGSGAGDRAAVGYAPALRRVHVGAGGGPDAFACASCHSKGGPDGAGTQTQNAFFRGDGESIGSADQRNPPHLLGLGPIELVAREMSDTLRAQAASVAAEAQAEGRRVERPLAAKGVSFGRIAARPDGSLDLAGIEGVDADLVVKPFGWKGHRATLRDIIEESFHVHQGVLSSHIQLEVRDGSLDGAPFGKGFWADLDEDGMSLEADGGMIATLVGYLAQLEAPVLRPPRDPGLLDAFAAGRSRFDAIGCAGCHMPVLELDSPKLDARAQPREPANLPFVIDVAKDGERPKVEPRYAGDRTSYLVRLFSDLKRHDMGEALASPAAQGGIPARVFLTRPLWGLAETAPYLHDGRAPTVHDAIVLHGGEAAEARDAYLSLDEPSRASVRVFLASLSRRPRLFVP